MATKRKTRVTEHEAAELAKYLEGEDYEIGAPLPREEWPAARRRGRPSLTGVATHSPQVSFRLPPDLHQRVQAEAAKQGMTVSTFARAAIEVYVLGRENARPNSER